MNIDTKGFSTNLAAIALVAVVIIAGLAVVFLLDPAGHNVTYNANGGVADADHKDPWTVKETNFESLDALFEKDGYAIAEWNTAADGSGSAYHQGDPVTGDCSVYAIWEKGWAVDYHANGGMPVDGSSVCRIVSERVPVSMYSNPGYVFIGWNTAGDGRGDSYMPTQSAEGAVALYAQWARSISDVVGEYSFEADKQLGICAAAIKGPLKGAYEITGNTFNACGDRNQGGVLLSQVALYMCESSVDAASAFDSMVESLKEQSGSYTVTESSMAGADRCVDIVMTVGPYSLYSGAVLVSNVWMTASDYYTTSSVSSVHAALTDMLAALPA